MKMTSRFAALFACAVLASAAAAQSAPVDTLKFSKHTGAAKVAPPNAPANFSDYWSGQKDVTIKTVGVDKVNLGTGVASPTMAEAAKFWNIDSRTRIGASHHLTIALPQLFKSDGAGLAKMTSVDTKQNSFGAQNARGLAKNSLTGAGNDIMPVSLITKTGGLGIPDGAGITAT